MESTTKPDFLPRPAETAPLSLRRNFSWTLSGNVGYAACQWGMLIVLAKFGSPELVGRFALAVAIAAPVMLFANLNLRAVQATDSRGQFRFGDYLALRVLTTALALAVVAGLSFVGGYGVATALVIVAVGASKAFESVSDVIYGLLQQHERLDRMARSMLIGGVLSLAAIAAVIVLTGDLLESVLAMAAVRACVLAAYDIPSARWLLHGKGAHLETEAAAAHDILRPRWDSRTLLRLTWLSLPLGIVMLLISLTTNVPRYFIDHYLGERALGIFAGMAYLLVAGQTIVNALGNAASPRLARYFAAGDCAGFRRLMAKLLMMAALLGGAGILVALAGGKQILSCIYTPEFAEQADVFVWIMYAAAASYAASFLGYGITCARQFRVQVPIFACSAGTVAAACLWLVPEHGLHGAALALIASSVVQLAGSAIVIGRAVLLEPHE